MQIKCMQVGSPASLQCRRNWGICRRPVSSTSRQTDQGGQRRFFLVVRFRQPFVEGVSRDVISYLKLSGSRLSSRPSAVSACGYMRKPTAAPADPGRATSCAKLYATQFISQDPDRSEERPG